MKKWTLDKPYVDLLLDFLSTSNANQYQRKHNRFQVSLACVQVTILLQQQYPPTIMKNRKIQESVKQKLKGKHLGLVFLMQYLRPQNYLKIFIWCFICSSVQPLCVCLSDGQKAHNPQMCWNSSQIRLRKT